MFFHWIVFSLFFLQSATHSHPEKATHQKPQNRTEKELNITAFNQTDALLRSSLCFIGFIEPLRGPEELEDHIALTRNTKEEPICIFKFTTSKHGKHHHLSYELTNLEEREGRFCLDRYLDGCYEWKESDPMIIRTICCCTNAICQAQLTSQLDIGVGRTYPFQLLQEKGALILKQYERLETASGMEEDANKASFYILAALLGLGVLAAIAYGVAHVLHRKRLNLHPKKKKQEKKEPSSNDANSTVTHRKREKTESQLKMTQL